jgi:hypothetical protein
LNGFGGFPDTSMYRYYKALPEHNRICVRAARDRAYRAHMDALKRMRTCVNTTQPDIPNTVGRNYKRFENEQQRNVTIVRDNQRLLGKMSGIQRREHYPRVVPERPFTLMGSAQKDEMARITHENHKLLVAVQERRPCLNRNEWLHHRLDHQYQITKMSEYKRTVPMGEIIRQEQRRIGGDAALPEQIPGGGFGGANGREQQPIGDVIGDTIAGSPANGPAEGGEEAIADEGNGEDAAPVGDMIGDVLVGA